MTLTYSIERETARIKVENGSMHKFGCSFPLPDAINAEFGRVSRAFFNRIGTCDIFMESGQFDISSITTSLSFLLSFTLSSSHSLLQIMPVFAQAFLRTGRAALSRGSYANPLQQALGVKGSAKYAQAYRNYATAFTRNKPHVNIGMELDDFVK